ncbi:MAG: DUF1643 domain-containing protein [Isosphaeraceae bacterium]|nr:DUF1643 domain-containing protein [Isosphaeraceae bacterium]
MHSQGARFSGDRRYRYALWRTWGAGRPLCNFVMLNPSTADETRDDATIARCRRRTLRWGFDGLIVTNLFALCATEPASVVTDDEPVGLSNDEAIAVAARQAALVVCAWGNHGVHQDRGETVLQILRSLGVTPFCLRLTRLGEPSHPLYLPYDLAAVPMALDAVAQRPGSSSEGIGSSRFPLTVS